MDPRVGSINPTWHFPHCSAFKGCFHYQSSKLGEKSERWGKDTGTGPAWEQGSSKGTAEGLLMPETTSGSDYALPHFSALQDFHLQHRLSCKPEPAGQEE